MSINLEKGQSIELTKEVPSLKKVLAGAGWDAKVEGKTMDLDLCALLLNASGKLAHDSNFVFFNNKTSPDGSVASSGDNLTGEGEGDDETISINLETVPADVAKIVLFISIYNAAQKGQSLADLDNCHLRIVNAEDNKELSMFKVGAGLSGASFFAGELIRTATGWDFTASGVSDAADIGDVLARYKQAQAA